MIQIYVCEDNPQQLRYFTEIIQKYLLMHDFSQKFVFGALNPKDLLEELEKKFRNSDYIFWIFVWKMI